MVQRIDLVATARELLGTPYENGQTVRHADELPTSIDCSGVMSWVSFKLFNSDAQLTAGKTNTTTARLMFRYLAEVTEPQPGDLAFYARSADADVAHVMMVTETGGVIGACDEGDQVKEYPGIEYTSRWILRGYRAFPLWDGADVDLEVDAVEQRAGQAESVALDRGGAAGALADAGAEPAARAGVGGGDQGEGGG